LIGSAWVIAASIGAVHSLRHADTVGYLS
jgi:hypothetical protein